MREFESPQGYSLFLSALGIHTVTFAFSLQDEGAHAPDEFFPVSSFERGQKAYCKLLERLGCAYPPSV